MRVRKVDDNQVEIVAAFRNLGCSVWITSSLGQGAPDIVVAGKGWCVPVEIKDGSKPPSQRKLTRKEEEWRDSWIGPYAVIESIDEAFQLVNDWNHKHEDLHSVQKDCQRVGRDKARERGP